MAMHSPPPPAGTGEDPSQTVGEFWNAFERLFARYNERLAAAGKPRLTWKELADNFGISDRTLSDWRKKRKVPPNSVALVQAAKYLGGAKEEWQARWRKARDAHERLLTDRQARRKPGNDDSHHPITNSPPPSPPIGRPRPNWARRALGLLGIIGVLALPASSANHPVFSPQAARCAYVTRLPATVFSAPSDDAAAVKAKDLGNGIEILQLPHPPGWSPVYTPRNSPGRNWMHANVLSTPVAGTRPCQDHDIATVKVRNFNSAEEQFYIGSDCRIYHSWQSTVGGPFSGWVSLGGCALARQELAVVMNSDSELVAFVIYSDHTVRYKSQPGPGRGPWPPDWTSLGGGNFYTGLHVVTGANGSSPIQVFADDKAGNVWENDQTQGNHWSGWHKSRRP
jgi:transcriptional regulator with XRE-family HTH domain